jgi:hypothetical protein
MRQYRSGHELAAGSGNSMSEGFWHRSEETGEVRWSGPDIWTVQRGPAILNFKYGDLEGVERCLLPDGSRGPVAYNYDPDRPASREGRAGLGGNRRTGDIVIEPHDVRFVDLPELEEDLLDSPRIRELVKDQRFADRLYSALCNIEWMREGCVWSTTWREAGRIVARLDGDESERAHLWFNNHHWGVQPVEIHEGKVTADVAAELAALGWTWREGVTYHSKAIDAAINSRRLMIATALGKLDYRR